MRAVTTVKKTWVTDKDRCTEQQEVPGAVTVTVSHPHHDQQEDEEEEDNTRHNVDYGSGEGDGDRGQPHGDDDGHHPPCHGVPPDPDYPGLYIWVVEDRGWWEAPACTCI